MRDGEKVYLEHRVPCWACSKLLATATTGANRGKFVAVHQRTSDGVLVLVHADCYQKPTAAETAGQGALRESYMVDEYHDSGGWRVARARQDQEIQPEDCW